jgi:hypothetical protein
MIECTGVLTKLITSTKQIEKNDKFLNKKREHDKPKPKNINTNVDDLFSSTDWREL